MRATCMVCPKTLPQKLLLQISASARQLTEQIELRATLQANQLFPPSMQVECRQAGCVGIGYLGYETVMCFICQEQACDPPRAHPQRPMSRRRLAMRPQWSVADGDAVPLEHGCSGVKECPKCGVLIEKDGGCDHMTCRMCRHEWRWLTGKPYWREGAE